VGAIEKVIIGTGEPIEEQDLMEFRLLYEGELLPSGNQKRPKEKHAIRRKFHPQLRRLWSVEKNLRELAMRAVHYPEPRTVTLEERFHDGLQAIGEKWSRVDYKCVPLVTADMALRCKIDILLLRPEEDRMIFESGDVDGQIKTLFDALRIPTNLSETGGVGPEEDETPFFCLLEDDRLISEVHVVTDRLLILPSQREVRANDSFVVLNVKLNHRAARTFDNFFG